jgi:magnesium-protoporphyrin O-methyltransferase
MAGCCTPSGYRKVFGERTARRDVRRYRRRGLDRAARRMADFLIGAGVAGDSVLEVGGGVGAIQLELLKAGAAHTTNVELSPEYEPYAAELLGAETRVERRLGDFVRAGAEIAAADDVVLHRVVCCYPDAEALVGAAAEHARRRLVLSFPHDTPLFRVGSAVMNAFLRLTGTEFRTFVHRPATILGAARGLEPAFESRTPIWRVVGFERARPEGEEAPGALDGPVTREPRRSAGTGTRPGDPSTG